MKLGLRPFLSWLIVRTWGNKRTIQIEAVDVWSRSVDPKTSRSFQKFWVFWISEGLWFEVLFDRFVSVVHGLCPGGKGRWFSGQQGPPNTEGWQLPCRVSIQNADARKRRLMAWSLPGEFWSQMFQFLRSFESLLRPRHTHDYLTWDWRLLLSEVFVKACQGQIALVPLECLSSWTGRFVHTQTP